MDNYNKLSLTGKKIKFHLKIDSGMHRLGFNNKEEIKKWPPTEFRYDEKIRIKKRKEVT